MPALLITKPRLRLALVSAGFVFKEENANIIIRSQIIGR
jgi:hypothetical protein